MSVFPDQLDTDLEIPRVDNNITEVSGDAINAIRDAVFSIQSAVGISPQGNKTSLAERVAVSIDSNGNIKSSALSSAGLVTLPIVDSHVGVTAGISESKLNLDFGTTVLSNRIDSAVVNVTANEASFNTLSATNVAHFAGTTGRHDGYDVDLTVAIKGVSTVEAALNEINNALLDHEAFASSIFDVVNIDSFNSITSDISNIQADIVDGRDRLHDSTITTNDRGESGTQGNLIDTTFASTIFQTDTGAATNILQVMRPNVARISSKALNLGGLVFGTKDKLRIQAGGMDRLPLDVDFGSPSIIPTDDVDVVVAAINSAASEDADLHYPISAYNVNGKIVIAHNIPGPQYTISIESVSQSAHVELGFGDVISTAFSWADGYHGAHIGGNLITDMKPLLRIRYVHGGGATITPESGNLLSLFNVSTAAQGRIICNILDHSVTGNNNNGTYYIESLTANTFQLNSIIEAGEFDIDIVADSVNFDSTATNKIYDIFIEPETDGYDGYGLVTKSLRVDYQSIPGITIKTVNKTFPTTGTIQWRVGNGDALLFIQDTLAGVSVPIPNGFRGQLKAFMPDNVNSALFEVTANTSSSLTQPITPSAFAGTDDKMYLSSVQHPLGSDSLQFVTDKRRVGAGFQDELDSDSPESSSRDLRNNGIIRGFDVISNTTNTLKIRGGRALVSGKTLDVETSDVTIDDFNSEFRLLALDESGMFKTFDADEPGYTTAELNADGYGDARSIATIVDFGTTASALTGSFVDRRLFVNKVDGRLSEMEERLDNRIDQLSAATSSLWGFTESFTTDPPDEFISDIRLSSNPGFRFLEEPGFSGTQTTRRYEFLDPNTDAYSLFRSPGLTHINVMLQVEFSDAGGVSPFGVSDEVNLQVGVGVITGTGNDGYSESYATVKTMDNTFLASNSVVEQYVVSVPVSLLDLGSNVVFDVIPRIRITGSTSVDGGSGGGGSPVIKFGKVRIITSSYSIAGNVSGSDGASVSLATNLGNVL